MRRGLLLGLVLVLAVVRQVARGAEEGEGPPVWLRSSIYDNYAGDQRVLKPWTPLRYRERAVSMWGRTYAWTSASLLPASITSQGVELLAGPMRLAVSMGGKEYTVPLHHFRFISQRPNRGEMVASGTVAGIRALAEMWIEYDGFLWVTLSFPDGPEGKVEAVRVIVPMPTRNLRLYQTFARPLAGWIGKEPLRLAWLANPAEHIVNFYHWFGDEERGLGFTYATLEHWAPAAEDNFCTLVPGAQRSIYSINLIEKPVRLAGRRFVFGVQATPIKPLPEDYHSMVSSALNWNPWAVWQQIPENLDTVVIWPPSIMRGLNDPYNVNVQNLRHAVRYVHARGVAALFTGCPQKIGPFSQEFAQYRQEWETEPESILEWEGTPHYQNCGRSYTLRKWLFYGWAIEIVDRFGLEGIYYDGWQAGTIACHNRRHGCGWADESGQRHLTVPVLEGREFNQRMCMFLEDHVRSDRVVPETAPPRDDFPSYHYRIHSWEFVPSVMGFATSWLTGEFAAYPQHGPSTLLPEGTFGKALGLGLFRARCLSTNWGVPNFFHVMMWEHTENHPTDRQTCMAFAWLLPHGVPLGELVYMNHKTVLEILRLMMAFDTRHARFIPCWRANPFWEVVQPVDEEVVLATWDHPDGRVLTVVSNLAVEKTHRVILRWKGGRRPQIVNARSGERLEVQGGRLRLCLAPETFVLLRCKG
jgi:hypothetical protein